MPQLAPVVINDGQATPVAYTFSPIGKDEKGVHWFEQTTPIPLNPQVAFKLSYKQTRTLDVSKQLTGNSKVSYVLYLPTPEVLGSAATGVTPPPTLAYWQKIRIEADLAERATAQEKKNTRVLAMNLLGHAMAIANIDTLQPSYS